MMKLLRQHRLYLPALTIIAVVLLLLLLIGISTYQNLDHEKQTALMFTHRQGLTIIRALEAGARTGISMPMWAEDTIQTLMQETAKSEDVAYIYLIDSLGTVVHHSRPTFEGMLSDWKPELKDKNSAETRIRRDPTGLHVYEIAKRFSPLPSFITDSGRYMEHHHRMSEMIHQHQDAIIILGLKLNTFDEARQADFQHALVMAAIVLALGSGAIFFIFVIQNYYIVGKALKQSEDYNKQVVDNMANGLLSIDLDGGIIAYNRLGLDLLRINESDVQHTNLKDIFEFEKVGIIETLLKCKPIIDKEIDYPDELGNSKPLGLSVSPITDNGVHCSGAVLIIRDLSEIKRLEDQVRQSEKLAAIGKFSAGVAHEIRNPLSSIRGFAQYLQKALSDRPREREYAEIMVAEVDRVNRVVTDLLTFARPLKLKKEHMDVDRLIAHAIRMVSTDAELCGVTIQSAIGPGLRKVLLDGNQMTQALLNLLLNALHGAGKGGSIEVGADMNSTADHLKIWVKDDGPGIPAENKPRIFEPFFTTREQGTGLGLSIVQKVAEIHGGTISVESPLLGESYGVRFTLTLPVINQV